ncbi:MAG: hypothetical protein C5B51_01580 [Terriglobia bacterium]|nr:MAG: hypothetical protein C5B51_01580 [Terriglobia bacterium]
MSRMRGVYFRDGIAYIRYRDEHGIIVRESTEQKSPKFAEQLLAKRKTEVAEGRHFPTKQFERTSFEELLSDWWDKHGQHTASRFHYHLPKVRAVFGQLRARDITSDAVQEFLDKLGQDGYAASSINKYRTILCSTFNFAIRRGHYDKNPASAVSQKKEPPGRDRFLTPEEFQKLIAECQGDAVLTAFVWLAATTGARKGELLARKWEEVELEGPAPHVYVPKTKNGRSKRLPLANEAITALKALTSFGRDDYLFPADRGNVRFSGIKEHLWDLRKPFQAACARAGITGLRIHDLRHMATTILFLAGIPDAVIRKLTGHKSRELERYQHLSPLLKAQTAELIAKVLAEKKSTATDTPPSSAKLNHSQVIEGIGGDDGARTRDLRRDRPAF